MRHPNRSAAVLGSRLVTVLVLGVFWVAICSDPAPACAQETEPAAALETPDEANAPGDDFVLEQPAGTPATSPADANQTPSADKSYLQWMAESLGISYSVVFLAISFTLVSLLVMNVLTARREALVPTALVEDFEALLDEEKYQDAYQRAKSDESMLGQVLSAGLAKLSRGYGPTIEAMQEAGEDENMKLEHRLSYIALIGTVSPMIGLLGTVQGMIASFQVIATSTAAPKPAALAEGIATALFTTLVGLMIAIPAIAAYNILRNRIARLVLEVGILSEDLMSRFSNVGVKKS